MPSLRGLQTAGCIASSPCRVPAVRVRAAALAPATSYPCIDAALGRDCAWQCPQPCSPSLPHPYPQRGEIRALVLDSYLLHYYAATDPECQLTTVGDDFEQCKPPSATACLPVEDERGRWGCCPAPLPQSVCHTGLRNVPLPACLQMIRPLLSQEGLTSARRVVSWLDKPPKRACAPLLPCPLCHPATAAAAVRLLCAGHFCLQRNSGWVERRRCVLCMRLLLQLGARTVRCGGRSGPAACPNLLSIPRDAGVYEELAAKYVTPWGTCKGRGITGDTLQVQFGDVAGEGQGIFFNCLP